MTLGTYKALLVDCDGTLAPAYMQVTPRVARCVSTLAKAVPVSIVSSRDHTNIRRLANSLGLAAPQISEGGAHIFDPATGTPLWRRTLEPEDARAIVAFLEGAGLAFSGVDGARRVEARGQITDWDLTRITATSLTPSQATELTERFADLTRVHTAIIIRTDNGRWMVDFTHAQATKASAVEHWCALLGISPTEVIAAGDSYNDLPLLRACGLRVAMGNAVPELKSIAHYVAPSAFEDGLAVAIEEFVLPLLRPA